ncbi:MAG: NAD(P)H-dependent oxidoreductase [Nitrosopumilus sp.]|nr:NAD(P)H-dependent oxidoreductase [Nitrosopumilus sp.]CAI9830666.1 NADH-dependent FMN reductase [Nitrosopumilaceae archaeon]MDA7941144.1 NAD(P)H-dependent oxidoreductase [Nitrosopumilus sp.]MDA7942458.1 NAD(P)H-dependent oxidoreductase [Nitrosopumilus sp.]MDA7945506.1 NAD(P)H-dependent oxidoreductase [Nitrosopumilus sp.]
MKVVVISGSPRPDALTQVAMRRAYDRARSRNPDTTFINLSDGQVECFRGADAGYNEATKRAAADIMAADVWIIGTPIYNSFFSAALKNLFEYVDYKKTEGKVAGMAILAAGSIGFTDVQTLLTQLLSYFRVVANPKAAYLTTSDIKDGEVSDDGARARIDEMVDGTLDLASRMGL